MLVREKGERKRGGERNSLQRADAGLGGKRER